MEMRRKALRHPIGQLGTAGYVARGSGTGKWLEIVIRQMLIVNDGYIGIPNAI